MPILEYVPKVILGYYWEYAQCDIVAHLCIFHTSVSKWLLPISASLCCTDSHVCRYGNSRCEVGEVCYAFLWTSYSLRLRAFFQNHQILADSEVLFALLIWNLKTLFRATNSQQVDKVPSRLCAVFFFFF